MHHDLSLSNLTVRQNGYLIIKLHLLKVSASMYLSHVTFDIFVISRVARLYVDLRTTFHAPASQIISIPCACGSSLVEISKIVHLSSRLITWRLPMSTVYLN